MIKFFSLSDCVKSYQHEIDSAVLSTLHLGDFILGDSTSVFERSWASFCGSKYCVSVGNGLDALYLSLISQNIGKGDEVIVPAHTFIATWLAVTKIGATPIPVDIESSSFNIDYRLIEEKITSKTKAIIPVHLYGYPSQIDKIYQLADNFGLSVIEDSAQAHGSCFNGSRIGGHGRIAAWSFYPGKNLGCFGDGGSITLDCEKTYNKLVQLRNYGSSTKYYHEILGVNSRLDEIQAAILNVRLKYLSYENDQRTILANQYFQLLQDIPDIQLPPEPQGQSLSWHLFVIRVKDRDSLQLYLHQNGIESLIHYPVPPYLQKAYSFMGYRPSDFPHSTSVSSECLSLPLNPSLSLADIHFICNCLRRFFL